MTHGAQCATTAPVNFNSVQRQNSARLQLAEVLQLRTTHTTHAMQLLCNKQTNSYATNKQTNVQATI